MEQDAIKRGRKKKEQAATAAAPCVETLTIDEAALAAALAVDAADENDGEESVELVPVEEVRIDKRSPRGVGKPSTEERADTDNQIREMKIMAGYLLLHFKQAVVKKELDFDQELKLFKEVSKYLGYSAEGNKTAEDIGMDSFAMKYLEINAKVQTVAKKSASKAAGK